MQQKRNQFTNDGDLRLVVTNKKIATFRSAIYLLRR